MKNPTAPPLWTKPFILLTLSTFFLFFGFYLLLPTMPLYITELGGDEAHVGTIIGLFMIAAVALRPFIGAQLDLRGRRPFVLWGLLSFAFFMFAHGWTKALVFLAMLRVLHGFSWAVSTTAVTTAVTDYIPSSRLGEGMSWYGLASTVAMALGPLAAVSVLALYAYEGVFTLGTILVVASFIASAFVSFTFQRQDEAGPTVIFDKKLAPVATVVFFFAIVYAGIVTFIPLFSQTIEVNPGLFFSVYAVALAVVRFVSGNLADRYGEATVIIPGLVIMIGAVLLIAGASGLSGIVIGGILFGIGFGAAHPILQASMVRTVRPDQRGLANATFITAFDLGIGFGSIALGWIPARGGFSALFLTTALSGAIALVVYSALFRRVAKQKEKGDVTYDSSSTSRPPEG